MLRRDCKVCHQYNDTHLNTIWNIIILVLLIYWYCNNLLTLFSQRYYNLQNANPHYYISL